MRVRIPQFIVDLNRLERLLWLLAAVGLGLALLGVAGERASWWNDVGELLITFGTVASVATGVLALLINATKDQVRAVANGVTSHGAKLDEIRDSHGAKLDQIRESHGAKLDEIRDSHGAKLDRNGAKLDRIHEDLGGMREDVNRHLENQHDVLVQIRDRL
jgi:vacuolar-type H+-ATPase subunit I/STV1